MDLARTMKALTGMGRITWLCLLVLGCGKSGGSSDQLPAYLVGDSCHDKSDQATCSADTSCHWFALELPCPSGGACPSGVCQAADPCRAHGDEKSCAADSTCMWAAVATALCPSGATCAPEGGFCTARSDTGCACACPVACPAGADCPPCACDCPPPPIGGEGGGGGGTCACNCPNCPAGTACDMCKCDCQPPPPTCGSGGGTCTCACPACLPGEVCPPCVCDCPTAGTGSSGGGTTTTPPSCTTSCPACLPGETCPPCEAHCDGTASTTTSPCASHTDLKSCGDDTANHCGWAQSERPCIEGQPCPAGVCFAMPNEACTCNCPVCPEGAACQPCDCSCPPPIICGKPTPDPRTGPR